MSISFLAWLVVGPEPYPPSHRRRDRGLAFQATLEVEPADKRLSLVLRIVLVIGPTLIERFDSAEASNLLARKTHLLELPHGPSWWGTALVIPWLSSYVSKPAGQGCTTANARIKLKYVYLAIQS